MTTQEPDGKLSPKILKQHWILAMGELIQFTENDVWMLMPPL